MALPVAELLVQLLHVVSSVPGSARPSLSDPVRMSWTFGVSPTPFTGMPFSVSACVLLIWLRSRMMSPCRSGTVAAIIAPFALCHGPVPMRSRALMGRPSGPVALRYARHCLPGATAVPDAAASSVQRASAPANPPRFAPSPLPELVMKNDIGAGGCCGAGVCAGAGFCASAALDHAHTTRALP